MPSARSRMIGFLMVLGGTLAVALAVPMVAIKYMTGWAIIPEPFWVPTIRAWLTTLFPATTPAALWTGFGTAYTVALLLVLAGFVALRASLEGRHRFQQAGYWLIVGGLTLVVPGDAIHSWTWHQNGLTVPTPGTNPVANTAYAVHMMGMNFVMLGSLILGITALRHRTLARWVAWAFTLVFPGALLASAGVLPTTPSGALWLLCSLMSLCGWLVAGDRKSLLLAPK
jgi:hypothetical protein